MNYRFIFTFLLSIMVPQALAGDLPNRVPAIPCPERYASLEFGLAGNDLEFEMRAKNLKLQTTVNTRSADGKPYTVELAIKNAEDDSVAVLDVDLRPGGVAYISHVKRDKELENFRVAGWLKQKLIEAYPLTKISQTLSESEFERVERGLFLKESPEQAIQRSVAYKNCLDLGFIKTTVKIFGNSVDLDCAR